MANWIIGVDQSDRSTWRKAQSLHIIDEASSLEDAMRRSRLIILAIPVDAMLEKLAASILDKVREDHVIMDVGSTKEKLLQLVAGHPRRGRFVAAHPMAGTELLRSGSSGAQTFSHKRRWCFAM